MAKFLGVKLSENIIKRHDDFIICIGAVIARTGFQIYRGSELEEDNLAELGINVTPDQEVKILRLTEDVFHKSTLASFEGVVFTLTHPDEFVNVDNISQNNQGHIQNVRMGTEPLPDGNWPLIADIYVTGRDAIDAILIDGVRELSCGYNYKLKLFNGNLCQYEILGNHVALVRSGRAGKYAAIKDSKPLDEVIIMATQTFTSKFLKAVGLHALAAKTTPEQFATALDAVTNDEEKEAVSNDSENKPEGEDAMEHKAGCKGGDSCTCKDSKSGKGKDSEFRERMHAALDRKIDAAMSAQAVDDDKTLASLLQGGNGGLKSKTTEGLDSEEHEGEDSEEEEDKDSEEEEGKDSEEEEGKDESEEGEGEDEAVESNPSPAIPSEDRFKTYVPQATDAAAFAAGAKHVLNMLKPAIAKTKDARIKGAFDTATKTVKGKAFGRDGYKAALGGASRRSQSAMDTLPKTEAQLRAKAAEDANAEYAKLFRKG